MPIQLLSAISPYFKPYIDLLHLSGDRYYFRKASTSLREADGQRRNWHPRIVHNMRREYHSPNEGILYVALPKAANLSSLSPEDLLYIGCSGSGGSRYWRGRPSETERYPQSKSCFHHEQMRRGRDSHTLEDYLALSGPVCIYTLTDGDVVSLCTKHQLTLPVGKYPAHQLERLILSYGFRSWKWNRRA